jgi:hypothetical protein
MKHHFLNVWQCFIRTAIELVCWIAPLGAIDQGAGL